MKQFFTVLVLLFAAEVAATTIDVPGPYRMLRASDVVVQGRFVDETDGRTFEVERVVKGALERGERLPISNGVPAIASDIFGVSDVPEGELVLVFARRTPSGLVLQYGAAGVWPSWPTPKRLPLEDIESATQFVMTLLDYDRLRDRPEPLIARLLQDVTGENRNAAIEFAGEAVLGIQGIESSVEGNLIFTSLLLAAREGAPTDPGLDDQIVRFPARILPSFGMQEVAAIAESGRPAAPEATVLLEAGLRAWQMIAEGDWTIEGLRQALAANAAFLRTNDARKVVSVLERASPVKQRAGTQVLQYLFPYESRHLPATATPQEQLDFWREQVGNLEASTPRRIDPESLK